MEDFYQILEMKLRVGRVDELKLFVKFLRRQT
jgi:hypothetical protein